MRALNEPLNPSPFSFAGESNVPCGLNSAVNTMWRLSFGFHVTSHAVRMIVFLLDLLNFRFIVRL
uniref:Uncharacterized protein n=1 Tax=Arundo donax TaxID=35708 RepID=A0A0A9EDV1_ARUDO